MLFVSCVSPWLNLDNFFPLWVVQIEILGASLPWSNIFNNKDAGAKFIKHVSEKTQWPDTSVADSDMNGTSNPFLSDSYDDGVSAASSLNNNVPQLSQPSVVTNWFDLLTGDVESSQYLSQTEMPNAGEKIHSTSGDALDFLDNFETASMSVAASKVYAQSQDENHEGPDRSGSTQKYINLVKSLLGSQKVM